jgi:hypothetical protein
MTEENVYEALGHVLVVPILAAGRGSVHSHVVAGGVVEGVHVEGMDGFVESLVVQGGPDEGLRRMRR